MKKFLLLAALACGSLSAMADVEITLRGSIQNGEGNFDVMFADTEVKGYAETSRRDIQFEITLPEGLSLVNQSEDPRKDLLFIGDTKYLSGALVGHGVGINLIDGSYRLVINSTDGSHLYNGRLCSFKVTSDDSKFAKADFIVKNITVSTEEGESVKPADINANAVPVKISNEINVGTVVAPYEITLPEGILAAPGEDNGKTVTVEGGSATLEAGVPSFIYGAALDATYYGVQSVEAPSKGAVLTGTFADQQISSGYVLQGGKLRKVNATVTLPAYKAYIAADGSSVKEFSLNGVTTGITVNEAINGEQVIYNVAGQRLNKTQKGVNIVNGKKYIVK